MKKQKVMTPKQADKLSLKIVKEANTGKITPRKRPDELHDFIVTGLACSACGGEILAEGIIEHYMEDGVRFGDPDGVIWYCKKCGFEVDENGQSIAPFKQHWTGSA